MVSTVVGAFVVHYLGAYLKRKGENLATREDIESLSAGIAATTEAAKRVEEKLSNETWDRQRRWELKKEALLALVLALGRVRECWIALTLAIIACVRLSPPGPVKLSEQANELMNELDRSLKEFGDKRIISEFLMGEALAKAVTRAGNDLQDAYLAVCTNPNFDWTDLSTKIHKSIDEVLAIARTELGLRAPSSQLGVAQTIR
jgi:hypothetical protein